MTADHTLADRLATDLDRAFPHLVRGHVDDVYSGVRRLVPSFADAEDVTQETFLRAYRALLTYDETRIRALRLRGWLWTIAVNLCRNAARSRSRRPEEPGLDDRPEPAAGDDPADLAVQSGDRDDWSHRLGALPTPMRHAVVLRHVADLPYADIAVALERPVGTVKADVHRGLERLRRMLEEEDT